MTRHPAPALASRPLLRRPNPPPSDRFYHTQYITHLPRAGLRGREPLVQTATWLMPSRASPWRQNASCESSSAAGRGYICVARPPSAWRDISSNRRSTRRSSRPNRRPLPCHPLMPSAWQRDRHLRRFSAWQQTRRRKRSHPPGCGLHPFSSARSAPSVLCSVR